jgi:hypothetical protein
VSGPEWPAQEETKSLCGDENVSADRGANDIRHTDDHRPEQDTGGDIPLLNPVSNMDRMEEIEDERRDEEQNNPDCCPDNRQARINQELFHVPLLKYTTQGYAARTAISRPLRLFSA